MEKVSMEKFKNGWWTAWLCDFEIGERQVHVLENYKVRVIRAVISRLVKDGLYFFTEYELGVFKIERVTFEKWMESKNIL